MTMNLSIVSFSCSMFCCVSLLVSLNLRMIILFRLFETHLDESRIETYAWSGIISSLLLQMTSKITEVY